MKDELKNIIKEKLQLQESDAIDVIFNHLIKFRYLRDEFCNHPKHILEDVVKNNQSNILYCPIDVVELRQIIKRNKPSVGDCFVLFSLDFAKKHFLDHPILLGYECKCDNYGQISICNHIEECPPKLQRVYIREQFLGTNIEESVVKILEEENVKVDVNAIVDYHSLRPKVYNANRQLKTAQSQSEPINLNDVERQIFDFLKAAKKAIPRFNDVKLLVAGGWVRDKLMGQESDDIDIAISHVTGVHFAQTIKNYANANGIDGVGKIYSTSLDKTQNLESAALEVAAIELFGQKVEFVNMRTETYTEESRVPIQTMTNDPAEDAKRRDLSINALYYNIETGKIEDYVGGLKDFEKQQDGTFKPRVIRTPADSNNQEAVNKIYEDDPLRLLRTLRFVSRYNGAELHPSIIEAAKNPKVLSLYDKLAPERASKEIRKMMQGNNPVEATKVLLETGLYKKVFKIPSDWHDIDTDQQNPFHKLTIMGHTLKVMENFFEMAQKANMPQEERGLMMLSTLLHDFGKMHPNIRQPKIDKKTGKPDMFDRDGTQVERRTYIGHDNESARLAKDIMTQMGFEPHEKKFVEVVTKQHMTPHDFDQSMKPKNMGRFLNQVGDLWERVMEHAHADALSKDVNMSEDDVSKINQQKLQNLDTLRKYREQMGTAINRPLIDGNRVKQIVEEVAPDMAKANGFITHKGKKLHFMSIINQKLLEQQWAQSVRDEEQAENFVRGQAKQLSGMWRQENKTANVKLADASAGASPNGYLVPEGQLNRDQGIVKVKRYIETGYQVGKKVRFHPGGVNEGIAFDSMEGEITSSNNNKIIVEWVTGKYKGKKAGFDLTDAARIARLEIL